MTTAAVRKNLAEKLLKALQEDFKKPLTRGSRANVLFLDNLDFINKTIQQVQSNYPDLIPNQKTLKFTGNDIGSARKIASRYQDNFCKTKVYKSAVPDPANTAVGRHLMATKPDVWAKIQDGSAFIFKNFNEIAEAKKEIIQLFFDKNSDTFKAIGHRVDRGHGGEGTATALVESTGAIGIMQETAKKHGVDPNALQQEFFDHIDEAMATGSLDISEQASEIKNLYIDYEKVVTKGGKVRARYIPIIEFQSKYDNRGTDGPREKEMKKVIRTFFEKMGAGELVSLEGSNTTEEQVFSHVINTLLIELKDGDLDIKLDKNIDPRKVKDKKGSSGKLKGGTKSKGKLTITEAKMAAGVSRRKRQRPSQKDVSPVRLMALINSRLPQTVAGNMGDPRLVNRTGRFAGSARVTDISPTAQGYPSIGYTYEKSPYGVFETTSGTRFASADRDPRPLIEGSIREIATQLIGGRFYTRRV
tara:strand:- start:477 stop:1895 length:1419 start_codon:yes stop_codon:yes gene_type:complete